MTQPLNDALIDHLRAHDLLQIDNTQIRRLREFLRDKLKDLDEEEDQDLEWIEEERQYLLEQWCDDFFLLSELVESPIEQQLGGYLLCTYDGYSHLKFDSAPGAFPDPEFGTYIRCQQELYDYRLDFLFKLNLKGDWKALNIECDGHPFHERTKEQAAKDRRRDRFLTYKGVHVIRFAGTEIYNRPRKCVAEVSAVLSTLMLDLISKHTRHRPRPPPAIPN